MSVRRDPVVGQNIGRHAGRWSPVRRACGAMSLLLALLGTLRAALKVGTDLVLENLALRQQLALLRRRSKRPRVGLLDRVFWMWLSRDRFPYRGLDGAAGCRGLPARLGAPVSHPRRYRGSASSRRTPPPLHPLRCVGHGPSAFRLRDG